MTIGGAAISKPVQNLPSFADVVTEPRREITIRLENTSDLSDDEAAAQLAVLLSGSPEYQGDLIHLSVGNASVDLNLFNKFSLQYETIGIKETIKPGQWAVDVGAVIKGATGGVSGSATVKVDVTHKDGKGAETTVKVEVTVTAKK